MCSNHVSKQCIVTIPQWTSFYLIEQVQFTSLQNEQKLILRSKMSSGSRITNDVASAIASLQSRRGSRYTDVIKTLRSNGAEPSFIQVKAALVKASEDGVVNRNSHGLWQPGSAKQFY